MADEVGVKQKIDGADPLARDLLLSRSEFFHDTAALEALAATVFPSLLRDKDTGMPLRAWVPSCGSGEEVYTLAILLYEYMAQLDAPPHMQLFATDIDEAALAIARRGRYDAEIAASISPERLATCFVPDLQRYQVIKAIRDHCLFSAHNPINDPPFGRMDLIACRNLLLSFDVELQRQLMPVLHYALAPGGYLFFGTSGHGIGADEIGELFWVIDAPHHIYQRKERLAHLQIRLPWVALGRSPVPQIDIKDRRLGPLGAIDIAETLQRILQQDYTPTAAIIDAQGMIAYLSGHPHPYLNVPAGAPTMNLVALVHPDLRVPLGAAIHTVAHDQLETHEEVTLISDGASQRLLLTVRSLAESGLLMVVMQMIGPATPLDETGEDLAAHADPRDALALELQRTRDTLEATISELQEANLDMMAVNEELRSLNEELQAANEELQTSQEEIQSINEELETVNAELSRKIVEIDRANADLANLFASTQTPTVFLHTDGRIARFTPQATELFALIDSDVGRPITDLNARFSDGDLAPLIAQVLQSATPVERLVEQPNRGRWWDMRIIPYRTLANIIDGVVITFADITALKRAEAVLQESHDALEQRVAVRTRELADTNKALEAQIVERSFSEQAREHLIQQLVTAQEEERRNIARELHDQLGQDLTALILELKALQSIDIISPSIVERIAQLQAMAVRISDEVRGLAVQLRPSVLDDLGLVLALSNYVEQWSARAHVAVDLHTSGLEGKRLPLAIETTIYRLVLEALTNVLKHAQASEVSVITELRSNEVRLIVEDDGVGFAVSDAPSLTPQLGLIGMRERVTLLGGTLMIETAPGSGTTIFVRIPLPRT